MHIKNTIGNTAVAACLVLAAVGCSKAQQTSDLRAAYSLTIPSESTTSATPAQALHPTDTITVGGHTLRVQIAGTAEEQAQGLSGIASIAEDEGTLFPFDPPATPSFWMKDMLFPIDIIWIRNNTIIGMSENLPRQLPGQDEDELPLYFPPDHIDAALEINAGLAKNYGFKIGDSVIVAE